MIPLKVNFANRILRGDLDRFFVSRSCLCDVILYVTVTFQRIVLILEPMLSEIPANSPPPCGNLLYRILVGKSLLHRVPVNWITIRKFMLSVILYYRVLTNSLNLHKFHGRILYRTKHGLAIPLWVLPRGPLPMLPNRNHLSLQHGMAIPPWAPTYKGLPPRFPGKSLHRIVLHGPVAVHLMPLRRSPSPRVQRRNLRSLQHRLAVRP